MTDKEYTLQKSRIQGLVEKWMAPLGLKWWNINIRYFREPLPISSGDAAAGWQCNAKAEAKWEYLSATVSFNLPAIEGADDEELERIVVHEFCHVLVHEMREWAPEEVSRDRSDVGIKHEERVVTALTSAFLWVRKSGEGKLKARKPAKRGKK